MASYLGHPSIIHPLPATNQIEYFYPRPCEDANSTTFPTASGLSIYYAFSIHQDNRYNCFFFREQS